MPTIDVKTQGPQPIHEQVIQLRAAALTRREAPVEVLFSPNGHMRALMVEHSDTVRFAAPPSTCYMGLPFRVVNDQTEDVALRCVPGGSEEARLFRAAQREGRGKFAQGSRDVADQQIAGANAARARMLLDNEPTLRALGLAATEAQLCDLIMAAVGPAIDAGTQTPLQRALHTAVENFGRFE